MTLKLNILNKFKKSILLFKSPLLYWIDNMFDHAKKNEWFETYWAIDIHGVISKPDYRRKSKIINYYPYAKETLQLLSDRDDVIMFLFTSSYPDEIKKYIEIFEKDGIKFNFINENPDIKTENGYFGYYKYKPYYNVLLEDKAGFLPYKDWKYIFKYFKKTKYRPNKKWVKNKLK